MKYVVIIPDGAADLPLAELDGRTPLQAAHTPAMDSVAALGRLGTARTTPPGFLAGSDVCTMSLVGYDPARYHTGRAPLEAAAINVPAGPTDWIFRVNLVTVGQAGTPDDGLMLDHSAGAITDAEAAELFAALLEQWRRGAPELAATLTLTHGVSYRGIMVDSSGRGYRAVDATPPHEIPRQPWGSNLPRATGAEGRDAAAALGRLMELSRPMLESHPVNVARRARGLRPANMAWIWGQGTRPDMPPFQKRFGLSGAMITAVDLLAGIARLIGWDRLPVPGVTSYHDTDYAAQGRWTCDALDRYDLVCCHVEAPDEASHQGDWKTKVASLESIDRLVVAPVLERLRRFGDPESDPAAEGWRVLIMPDHYTLVSTRKHDATPTPFCMAGAFVRGHRTGPFCEAEADASDLHVDHGHELMEFFLFGGRPGVRAAARSGPGR